MFLAAMHVWSFRAKEEEEEEQVSKQEEARSKVNVSFPRKYRAKMKMFPFYTLEFVEVFNKKKLPSFLSKKKGSLKSFEFFVSVLFLSDQVFGQKRRTPSLEILG